MTINNGANDIDVYAEDDVYSYDVIHDENNGHL